MAFIYLKTVVPVVVVVDTKTEEVARVVVIDEEVDAETLEALEDDNGGLPQESLASKARQIAKDADWPAWEFGW